MQCLILIARKCWGYDAFSLQVFRNLEDPFHRQTQQSGSTYMKQVELTLRQNHAVLAQLPWGEERSLYLSKLELESKGFDFHFCTGLFTNNKARQFFYVYDFAWSEKEDEIIWVLRK